MHPEFYKIYRDTALGTMSFSLLTGGIFYYKTHDFGVMIITLLFMAVCSLAALLFQGLYDLNSEEENEDEFEEDDDNEFDDDDDLT